MSPQMASVLVGAAVFVLTAVPDDCGTASSSTAKPIWVKQEEAAPVSLDLFDAMWMTGLDCF
jgi:hypothetical protein